MRYELTEGEEPFDPQRHMEAPAGNAGVLALPAKRGPKRQ
jgi:hypothetical protein